MLRLSVPLIIVQDLPAAIKSRSRFSSSGVQRTLGITQSFLHLQPELDQAVFSTGWLMAIKKLSRVSHGLHS
jgi:hypothetical protein